MRFIGTILLAFSLATPLAAQAPGLPGSTAETRTLSRQVLDLTNAVSTAGQMMTAMQGTMAELIAKGSSKPLAEAEKIVSEVLMPSMQERVGELGDMMVEVYASNFTADELRGLIQFYDTPLGKRMIAVTPKLGIESAAAGQAWGTRVARDAIQKNADELRRRGVTL